MGSSTSYQTTAQSSANDSIFGMALAQAFMGFTFGAGVDTAWEAAEIGSGIYADRHSSSARKAPQAAGTNGFELGVKNSLAPFFGQQTRPRPVVDLNDTAMPYWHRQPAPVRGRAYAQAF